MTPHDLEARLAAHPDTATVTAVVNELATDADWAVTTVTRAGRLVQVELLHHPTGTSYTLTAKRREMHP